MAHPLGISASSNSNRFGVGSSMMGSYQSLVSSIGLHHDEFMVPRGRHPANSLGQPGASQRMIEVKRTYVTPHRVQVHSVIDYFPGPNIPSSLYPGGIFVAETVTKTNYLPSNSPWQSLHDPNGYSSFQGSSLNNSRYTQSLQNFQNRNLAILSNRANLAFSTTTLEPSSNFYHPYNPRNRPRLNLMSNNPATLSVLHETTDRVRKLTDGDPNTAQDQNPDSPFYQRRFAFPDISSNHPERNPAPIPDSETRVSHHHLQEKSGENETGYDGRTHSLPHQKYGPYTCPRCERVFEISQTFAAHMLTHYKDENNEERRRRLAAKYKKKNLYIVESSGVVTILPSSKDNAPTKVYRRKNSRKARVADHLGANELVQEQAQENPEECNNSPEDVIIKQEDVQETPEETGECPVDPIVKKELE